MYVFHYFVGLSWAIGSTQFSYQLSSSKNSIIELRDCSFISLVFAVKLLEINDLMGSYYRILPPSVICGAYKGIYMRTYKYSKWDGTQDLSRSLDENFGALSKEILEAGDVNVALGNLVRDGFKPLAIQT